MNEHTERINKWLEERGINFNSHYVGTIKKWGYDKEAYAVSLYRTNNAKVIITEFYSPNEPSAYDVLSCLQKYEPESKFSEFMKEFGYSVAQLDEAERAWQGTIKEYEMMSEFFSESELAELQEIAQ